jgi:predicted outer membrane repeat protein
VGSDWYYGIPIIVWDSFVLDNSAARGGGILVSLDDLVIKNAVFAGNTATEEGGAVFMAGWVSASGASFEGNAAGDCGGAIFLDGGDADEFLINSCAFGANTAPEHPQIGVPSTDWPTDPWNRAINSVFLGGFPGRRSIAADPGFASTAYPYDLSLQAGSPCIDAADSRAVPLLDIEGNPRTDDPSTPDTGLGPADHADIGAYEF